MTDMIILRERVITIKAGDTFDQSMQGNVLRVTAGMVPLRVQDRNQQMDFTLLAGERAEFTDGEFPGLILSHTSGVDQTFKIQVGKGVNVASALVSGTVTITGTPTVNVQSVQNTVKVLSDGFSYGACWKSRTVNAANSAVTIVSPAANIDGLIVHAVRYSSYSSYGEGKLYQALVAHTSAPSNLVTGDVILSTNNWQPSGANTSGTMNTDVPILVPAGKGLYVISNVLETDKMASILYTIK